MIEEPAYPREAIIRTVWRNGVVTYDRRNIGWGSDGLACRSASCRAGKLIHVYYGKIRVRSLWTPAGSTQAGTGDTSGKLRVAS